MGERKPKRGWRRRVVSAIWGCCLGVLMVAAAGLVLYGAHRHRARAFEDAIAVELDAIRAAGYPATLKELDEWYAYPDGPNAADVYAKAFAKFTKDDGKRRGVPLIGWETELPPPGEPMPEQLRKTELPPLGEPMSEEMKRQIAAFLADNAEAIGLLHEAATIKACRYPIDLTLGHEAEHPHALGVFSGAERLQLTAALAAEEGRWDDAVEAVRSDIALAESLRNEPDTMTHLVRVACLESAADALQWVLSKTALSSAQRTDIAAQLKAAETPEAILRVFAAERCMMDARFLPDGELSREIAERVPFGRLIQRFDMTLPKARLLHLRAIGRYIAALDVPLHKRLQPSPEDGLKTDWEDATVNGERNIPFVITAGIMWSTYGRQVAHDLQHFALCRVARTALAVEGFREAEKRLPESLGELVPKYIDAVPLDPFDGKPLRFKKREKGYVVYSIGEDGTDDDGIGPPKSSGPIDDGLDVPFRVVR